MEEAKTKKWYLRKETWGVVVTLLSFSPELINWAVQTDILADYTLLAKLALPIGILLNVLGLRKGWRAENLTGMSNSRMQLPSGLRKRK